MAKKKALASPFVPVEEQPYSIPENWCWTTVDNVATVITGGTPSKKNPEYYGDEFPFVVIPFNQPSEREPQPRPNDPAKPHRSSDG